MHYCHFVLIFNWQDSSSSSGSSSSDSDNDKKKKKKKKKDKKKKKKKDKKKKVDKTLTRNYGFYASGSLEDTQLLLTFLPFKVRF